MTLKTSLSFCFLSLFINLTFVQAQEPQPSPTPAGSQKVDLAKFQQKYLVNAGTEVQVVQNRIYTKAHKYELGVMGGFVSADPFLNIMGYGGFLGHHFSEYFGVRAFYWKDSSKKSPSWSKTGTASGQYVNTNAPLSMMGAEAKFTPLYGKVSVLGTSIIYFDLSVFGGAGIRKTESGSNFSPIFGVGQQLYFAKSFSFGIDYRIMKYSEKIIDSQTASATFGQVVDNRSDFTSFFFLSVSYLLGH